MILIVVEDETPIRMGTAIFLRKLGYEVYEAANGQEALMLMKEVLPDLVLIDMLMPVMNGEELIEAMKKDKRLKKVDFVLYTNYSDLQIFSKIIASGYINPAEDIWVKAHASFNKDFPRDRLGKNYSLELRLKDRLAKHVVD